MVGSLPEYDRSLASMEVVGDDEAESTEFWFLVNL